MTSYTVTGGAGAGSFVFGVMPGPTKQLKLIRVEATINGTGSSSATSSYSVLVYPSSTISGGTLIAPFASRVGAGSSTATAKSGGTISGTSVLLHAQRQVQTLGSNVVQPQTSTNLNDSFTPTNDLILESGSTIWVTATGTTNGILLMAIVYEELNLKRSN